MNANTTHINDKTTGLFYEKESLRCVWSVRGRRFNKEDLADSENSCIFAQNKKIMSEDIKNDEMTVDVASEPMTGYALNHYPSCDKEMEIDYNFQGKDFGYARTLEELELALDEADAERNDPSKWITSVEFHTRLESKYSWLR